MFICSMKMSKKKILAIGLTVLVVLVFIICFVMNMNSTNAKGAESKNSGSEGQSVSLKVKGNEDIAEYIRSFGWEVEPEPCEVVEVTMPEEFNDVFKNYNEIQKKQGFNLEKYKGKLVKRTTFVVTNYPDYPQNIRADVMTCKDVIIGADICSIEIAGFMHGLNETRG